jgi:hypothetical protein
MACLRSTDTCGLSRVLGVVPLAHPLREVDPCVCVCPCMRKYYTLQAPCATPTVYMFWSSKSNNKHKQVFSDEALRIACHVQQ